MDSPKRSNIAILVRKSIKIQTVNARSYLALYFSPVVVLLTLILYQHIADRNNIWENLNPAAYSLDKIPLCRGEHCKTLAYAVVGDRQPYIDHVISHVKRTNDIPDSHVVEWKRSPNEIMEHLKQYPNATQTVVIFCTSRWQISDNFSVPCYADNYHMNFYTIIYNITLFYRTPYLANLRESYPKDKVVVRLKRDIDEALINFYTNSTVEVKMQDYPNRNSRFLSGLNVSAQYGSFFFLIPYLIYLVLEVSTLLKEKEDGLRIGLSIVGVTPWQFYVSNFVV